MRRCLATPLRPLRPTQPSGGAIVQRHSIYSYASSLPASRHRRSCSFKSGSNRYGSNAREPRTQGRGKQIRCSSHRSTRTGTSVRLRADCASPFPPTPWCPTYCAHFAILWGRVLFGVSYRDGTISINEFVELWRTTGLSKPVLRQHFRRRDLGSVGQLSQPPALHARAHPGALSLLNSLPNR